MVRVLSRPTGKVIWASSRPSMDAAGTLASQSSVLTMRACSSANVVSLSSNLGASMPARRAVPFLAASQAMRICAANGSMSGARRMVTNTLGSNFRAAALASAFFRQCSRLDRAVWKTGRLTDERVMGMDLQAGGG